MKKYIATGCLAALCLLGFLYSTVALDLTDDTGRIAQNVLQDRLAAWETSLEAQFNTSMVLSGDVVRVANTDTTIPADSQSATNAAAVTLDSRITILSGIGGANDTTNTITLANPGTQGLLRTIMIARASSNLILLAESDSNLDLSGNWLGDNLDNITLYAETPSNWVEIGSIDN